MYRKILALLLVCVMVLSIAGCKKKNKDLDTTATQPTVATQENEETVPVNDKSEGTKPTESKKPEQTEPVSTLDENSVKIDVSVTPSPDDEGNDDDINNPVDTPTETTQPTDGDVDINDFVPSNPIGTEPKETEPKDDNPVDNETQPVTPEDNNPEYTEPGSDDDSGFTPVVPDIENPTAADYEWYITLSGAEQSAFVNTFAPKLSNFFVWYNAAQTAYNLANPSNIIGGGTIDGGNIG